MAAGIWSAPTGIFASTVTARTVVRLLQCLLGRTHILTRFVDPVPI